VVKEQKQNKFIFSSDSESISSNSDATLPIKIPNQSDIRNSNSPSNFKAIPVYYYPPSTGHNSTSKKYNFRHSSHTPTQVIQPVESKIKPPSLLITFTSIWRKAVTKLMKAVPIDSIVVKVFRNECVKIQCVEAEMVR